VVFGFILVLRCRKKAWLWRPLGLSVSAISAGGRRAGIRSAGERRQEVLGRVSDQGRDALSEGLDKRSSSRPLRVGQDTAPHP